MKKSAPHQNKIKQLRIKKGLSSADLAELIGTSRPHMSRLENGKSPLDADWILKISAALEVPTTDVADVSFTKKFNMMSDDTMVGSILGWLLEANDHYKAKLSHKELSTWATYIYKKSAKRPNADLIRDLTFTVVEVIKLSRG